MRRSMVLATLFVILSLVVHPGVGAPLKSDTQAVNAGSRAGEMPDWPVPDQPIPQHRPGHPSKAKGYTTQVTRQDEDGQPERVQLNGLDAMLADDVISDPLAGNYELVSLDKLMFSSYIGSLDEFHIHTRELVSPTLNVIAGSQVDVGDFWIKDVAAGDLNGDHQAEQIAAWVDPADNHIHMSVGEMPGTLGKAASSPAAISRGSSEYSLEFDGDDDHVVGPIQNYIALGSFTVAFWAKRDAIDDNHMVIGLGEGAPNQGLHIGFRSSNTFTCGFWGNDLDTPVYTDLEWHHWACTYDWDGTRTIYRDGVQVAQDKLVTPFGGYGALYIGTALGGDYFDGLIDEVVLWDVARTPEQIQADQYRIFNGDETGLETYFRFEAGDGFIVWDNTNDGDYGVLENGTAWSTEVAPIGDSILLVRGYDQALWRCYFDLAAQNCLHWENSAGGLLLSGPAVTTRGGDRYDVFSLGVDNHLYHNQWGDSAWSGWQDLDASDNWPAPEQFVPMPEYPAPVALARGAAQLDLFRLAPDNTLGWRHSDDEGASWGDWQSLGGLLASGPGAVSLGAGHMQVFAAGVDGALWHRSYTGGWGEWGRLEGPVGVTITSTPVAVSPDSGAVRVYIIGSDGVLYQVEHNGVSWGGWSSVSADEDLSGIGAVVSPDGAELFAHLTGGELQYSHDGASWTQVDGLDVTQTLDIGAVALAQPDPLEVENEILDITAGYFSGDGRQQIALSYQNGDGNIELEIYDIYHGFTLTKTAGLDIPITGTFPRIAAGDVDGDGIDEIGLVYVIPDASYEFEYEIKIYSTSVDDGNWSLDLEPGGKTFNFYPSWFAGTLRIAAGNVDNDVNDELVVVSDWVRGLGASGFHLWAELYVYNHDDIADVSTLSWDGSTTSKVSDDAQSTGLGLDVGDVNADGVDEVVVSWPIGFIGGVWPELNRSLQVYDARDVTAGLDLLAENGMGGYTITHLDTLAVGDLDRDLQAEIVFYRAQTLYYFEYNGPSDLELIVSHAQHQGGDIRVVNLVMDDFTGESLVVGPPSFRVQQNMTTPVAFINLPPMHRDIIKNASDENIEFTIGEGLYAEHSAGNSSETWSSVESQRDWSLSAGVDVSVGAGGHSVSASLNNTYGEDFSETAGEINELTYRNTTTADLYDQLLVNQTSYAVWEYPIIGLGDEGGQAPKTIAVTWPLVETTNTAATKKGHLCDENFYTPRHQIYNVWSYDPVGVNRFADFERELNSHSTTGGTNIELTMTGTTEEDRSSSFHNQISAGVSYSYQNSLSLPLIGKAWDFSFRAYVDGSYGFGQISNFGTKFTEESQVVIDIPSAPASAYEIMAFLYWATGGYLVVDYQTAPQPEGAWLLYDLPDPAFTLPWYGFPDTAGVFPPLPDPDAPPCGLDKQLFSHDVQFSSQYVDIGETVVISGTVRNLSDANPLSDVLVRFYQGYPDVGNDIGECSIPFTAINRNNGPQTCSVSWVVNGAAGEQKIYARIDPLNVFDEMHDEDDVIDNNIAYGLLYVAEADYLDPGLSVESSFQGTSLMLGPGLQLSAFLPTTNISETLRVELLPFSDETVINDLVGSPFRLDLYHGGESEPGLLPEDPEPFAPTPLAISVRYSDGDISGMDEDNLQLYIKVGQEWYPAGLGCTDWFGLPFQPLRFPDDNRIVVPVCQAGPYALSDANPGDWMVYMPIIIR